MDLKSKMDRARLFINQLTTNSSLRWQIGFGLIVVFLVITLMQSMLQKPANMPRESDFSTALRVIPAGNHPDVQAHLAQSDQIVGDGVVEPSDREIKVGGATAGRIAKIFVVEGQSVNINDPLLQLENKVELAQLATADAAVRAADAAYKRILHGLRPEDVHAIAADALAAKARLDNSKANLERVLSLEQKGASTKEELQKARDQTLADLNTYRSLESKRQAAAKGSRSEDIEEAKAQWEAAIAKRDEARANLDRLTVNAPISGKVLFMLYRVGEYYNPNNPGSPSPLFVIGDVSVLRVRMDVDERDIANLQIGANAFVTADSFPGQKFTGRIVEIGKRMGRKNIRTDDPTERIDTKILEVVIQLNQASQLVPGLRVTCFVNKKLEHPPK